MERPLSERFPTAPRWFRPVLEIERVGLGLAFGGRRRRTAASLDEPTRDRGAANLQLNILGNLAAERLVPGQPAGWIFAQHVARYVWALQRVSHQRVAELGCGLGYGAELLSWSSEVVGVDLDVEAIETARATYARPGFRVADITDPDQLPDADVGVCFEVIEHVDDPGALLTGALARYERLLLSTPNPLAAGSHINPHHRNDWPPTTLWAALRRAGARRIRWYRQGLRSAPVRRGAFPWSGVWLVDATR